MKKMYWLFFTALILTITSCDSLTKETLDAAKFAGEIWGATSTFLSVDKTADGEHGKKLKFILTMNKLRSVPENYPAQRIASASAIAFVQNLKEEVVNEYDAIKIVFDRGKGEETQEILVKDVQDAIRLMPTVSNFLEVPAKNGFAERKKYVDATFLPDSILSVLETMLVQTDSLYGSTTSHQIGGFRMDHLKGTNDPVMVVWAISEKDKAQIPYTFIVSQQSAKIISISTEKNY